MDPNLIIVAVSGIAVGFAIRGWYAYQQATAKTRLLKIATRAVTKLGQLHTDNSAVVLAAQQAAGEKAQLEALKAAVAAM
jgi:hypothetical protein